MNKEWHDERGKGIGGSEAAAVLGLSRYKSALQVYLEKIGEVEPQEDNDKMYWGRVLEAVIADEYARRTDHEIKTSDHISWHDAPWFRCNPDRLIYGDPRGLGVLECKTASEYVKSEWDDQVPEEYLIQLMHNIGVCKAQWGALAVLIGGSDYRIFEFDRDDDLITILYEKERAFWFDHVLAHVPPDPTGASLDVLSKLYRRDNGSSITLADDAIGKAITSYLDAKANLEAYTKQKEDSEAIIKSAMGEASRGIYQGADGTAWGISWTTCKGRIGFDAKTFEKDHPELYQKYMKQGADYRRFMVKGKKTEIANAGMALIGG